MTAESEDLRALYTNRSSTEGEQRQDIWEVLWSDFFQRWVPEDAVVLNIAAGHCESNNIRARPQDRGRPQPRRASPP